MKKFYPFASILLLVATMAMTAFSFRGGDDLQNIMSASGAPAGYSGDPAGGSKDCTNCHAGTAQQQAGWITSNVPETGYVAGTTYTIISTASGAGITKFGFQVSAQNSGGSFLGTLVNTSAETKLVSGTNYVTHTSAGNTGNESKTWTFDWTAPAAGSGEVIFYGAFNLANNNGGSSGDAIILSTLAISEDASTGSYGHVTGKPFTVYPNPARDYLMIDAAAEWDGLQFLIYDKSGRQVLSGSLSDYSTTIPLGPLEAGMYHLQIRGKNPHSIMFLKD